MMLIVSCGQKKVVERIARRLALEYNTGLNRGYLIALGENKRPEEVNDNGWQNYLGDARELLRPRSISLKGHLE